MHKKRGQVTVFIIIGIIMLFAVGVFFYIRNMIPEKPVFVPEKTTAVHEYVQTCMKDIGIEAVNILGMQSGYTEIPERIALNPYSYIALDKERVFKLPYWYYKGENRMPTLNDMEEQVNNYMNERLLVCLDNFSVFEKQYNIKTTSDIKTETDIGSENVIIKVFYDVEIADKQNKQTIKATNYITEIPVRLGRVYELAKKIMISENKDMFLENFTIDFMSMDPKIPITGFEFTPCHPITWYVSDVKKELQNVLYYNIPEVRIKRTDYMPIPASDLYAQKHFLWSIGKDDFSDLKASLLYMPNWGIEIHVRPSRGNIMKSNMGQGVKGFLSYLCLNIYHFTYDVVYPVKVIVRDDDLFNGEGYTFSFAFPVMINHNEGDRENFGIVEYEQGPDVFGFCNQRTINTVGIKAYDIYTYEELKDVNISFRCVNYECDLGKTSVGINEYILTTTVPSACMHGLIVAKGPNYLETSVPYQDQEYIDIDLYPLKEFDYELVKHVSTALGTEKELEEDEFAVVYITDVTDKNKDDVIYKKEEQFVKHPNEEGFGKLKLLDMDEGNTYLLDIMLIKDEDIIGGYKAEWSFNHEQISGKTKVVFHVIEKLPHPSTDGQKYDLINYLETNEDYKVLLRPTFK